MNAPRFLEAHSEVSFRAMKGERPLEFNKRAASGVLERAALLRAYGIEVGELGSAATYPVDDVLDPAACAWTANRIALGAAKSLPAPPERSAHHDVAIWY